MGEQAPSPGQVSGDGQFVWDGTRWNPITAFRWEPTRTTRQMQLQIGGYLLATGLLTALLTFFTVSSVRQATEKTLRDQTPGITPDQLKSSVDFIITIGTAGAVVIGFIYLVFGLMTLFRRWSWLFYADMVICGITGFGVFTGLFGLARGTAGPPGLVVPNLILSAAGLALFIWLLLTRLRGSVWGARKVPAG